MSEQFSSYVLSAAGSLDNLNLVQREFPVLTASQVLVKMECSTINPSDYLSIFGKYPVQTFPIPLGYEGSGTVVKSGGSDIANSLLNKRVAVLTAGTWSEYAVVESQMAFPLLDSVSFEQAAGLCVNPMTVAYMIDIVKSQNRTFVQNAAASALGKQLTQWAKRLGIQHINLVRRQEQVDILRALGAEHVFNTSQEGWLQEAKKVVAEIKPSIGFDAIGGAATIALGDLLVDEGVVHNYGLLSGENPQLSSLQLIFQQKKLVGLWLRPYLSSKDYEGRMEVGRLVQENIDIVGCKFNQETNLTGLKEALGNYMEQATNNKVLIRSRL